MYRCYGRGTQRSVPCREAVLFSEVRNIDAMGKGSRGVSLSSFQRLFDAMDRNPEECPLLLSEVTSVLKWTQKRIPCIKAVPMHM